MRLVPSLGSNATVAAHDGGASADTGRPDERRPSSEGGGLVTPESLPPSAEAVPPGSDGPELWSPVARRRSNVPYMLVSIASLVTLVLLWYLLTDVTHAVKPLYFPSIGETWTALSTLGWTLAQDAGATAWRVLVSWAIGCALGTAVGLVLARSRIAYAIANPVIEGLRPVPPIALVPFTLIWFGLTDTGRIVLGALSCFMILVVSTVVAARNVNPIYIRAAQSLGATSNQVYRTIVLRAILPNLVSAFRVAAALTWAVVVAAEYLGAQSGIGYLILQASYTVNTAVVLIGTVTVGLEAFLFEQLLRITSGWLTRWVERIETP